MPTPARRIGHTATFFPEMRSTSASSFGVVTRTVSVGSSFVASYVRSSVSSLTSWRNIWVFVCSSRSRPSLCADERMLDRDELRGGRRGPRHRPHVLERGEPAEPRVERARLAEREAARPQCLEAGFGAESASTMMLATSRRSASSNPRIVTAGVPSRTPDATVGGRSSYGTVLRFAVMRISCSRSSASFPVQSERRRSSWTRCVSVPPVSRSMPPADQRLRQHVRVRAHLRLVGAERLRCGDPEARRLGRDRVLERPALHSRKHRPVERLRVLLLAEHEAAARAPRASCASSR